MNELLARTSAFFLAPAAPAADAVEPQVATPRLDCVGVLAAADDLRAVAGAVAADLRRRARARTAVVCIAGAAAGPPAPALPAATALARRLGRRELPARAAGALAVVGLPEDARAAAQLAWRVIGAASAPVVVAAAGRDPELDPLLAQMDGLRVAAPASADRALAELALASLAALGPPAVAVAPPAGTLARRLAALGLVAASHDDVPATVATAA
ncbi:MAG TPA: hypothetical protein VM266_00125 [Solirubrobacteraceae bacterium]|nr:hypothetical protein [Solirubrobacteraceae bacterium]